MSAPTTVDDGPDLIEVGRAWWLFLVTGVAWVIIGFIVLASDSASVGTIALLMGCVLIAAGVNEFMTIALVADWKWLHGVLGALFVVAGILALSRPFQTFGILALLIGWYLLVKGTFDLVMSIAGRHSIDLWGLLLASGLIQMAIGVWAIGSPARSAWLLILWIGLSALFRGITEIVVGFQLHHAGVRDVVAA